MQPASGGAGRMNRPAPLARADREEPEPEAGLAGARALRAAGLPQPEAGPLRLVRPPCGPVQVSTLCSRQREGRLYHQGSSFLPRARPLAVPLLMKTDS